MKSSNFRALTLVLSLLIIHHHNEVFVDRTQGSFQTQLLEFIDDLAVQTCQENVGVGEKPLPHLRLMKRKIPETRIPVDQTPRRN